MCTISSTVKCDPQIGVACSWSSRRGREAARLCSCAIRRACRVHSCPAGLPHTTAQPDRHPSHMRAPELWPTEIRWSGAYRTIQTRWHPAGNGSERARLPLHLRTFAAERAENFLLLLQQRLAETESLP